MHYQQMLKLAYEAQDHAEEYDFLRGLEGKAETQCPDIVRF